MNIFIIIPAYNEAKTIGSIVKELSGKGFRVVVVDDGSSDHTVIDANKFGAEVIVHSRNAGKGRCVREGLIYALENGCGAAVTIDGDGQHDLKELDKFIEEYKKTKADIILGNRMTDPKKMPFIRRCTNLFMSFIISSLLGRKIDDSQCGYRLISRNAIEKMSLSTVKYEIETEILIEAKNKNLTISSVKINSIYENETSQINPFFDTLRFLRFIIHVLLQRKT
jgi:glycosyltransferase involved in cell wall biosynthesis